jgi:hypothetical protein
MHPEFHRLLQNARQIEIREAADRARLLERNRTPARDSAPHLTLRLDRVGDAEKMVALAALSACSLQAGPFVVAEVNGTIVAALHLADGTRLADPFVATAHLFPLLELRAQQLRESRGAARLRGLRRVLPRLSS